jgi:hypothetical protein
LCWLLKNMYRDVLEKQEIGFGCLRLLWSVPENFFCQGNSITLPPKFCILLCLYQFIFLLKGREVITINSIYVFVKGKFFDNRNSDERKTHVKVLFYWTIFCLYMVVLEINIVCIYSKNNIFKVSILYTISIAIKKEN